MQIPFGTETTMTLIPPSGRALTFHNLPKCNPDPAANDIIRTEPATLIRPERPLPRKPFRAQSAIARGQSDAA